MARKNYTSVEHKVTNHLGVLKHGTKSWSRQVNLVSWNNGAIVLDIRDWDYGQEKFGKGITMTAEEASRLRDILNQMNLPQAQPLDYPEPPVEEGLNLQDSGFGFVE